MTVCWSTWLTVRWSLRQAVTDAELLSYHDRLLEHRPRLEAFSVLRAALAPLIEAVVLLDRLAFLLEQVSGMGTGTSLSEELAFLERASGTGTGTRMSEVLVFLLEQVSAVEPGTGECSGAWNR